MMIALSIAGRARHVMLRILGSHNPFRNGVNRREAMCVAGLSALSLGLPELLKLQSLQAGERPHGKTFGKAKRILLVYLQGAATQHETWDPKPDAPKGIRGAFGATPTSVPGVDISDGLPKMAQLMHRVALVRSMTHKYNNHSNHYTLTGYPTVNFSSETNPFDSRHHPFFGSVLDYLAEQQADNSQPAGLPRNIGLPWKFSSFSPVFRRSGPYGAFLGHAFDPVWTEFDGKATKTVNRSSFFQRKDVEVKDPFLGVTPGSRLRISKTARMRRGMTLDRLDRRRSLLQQLESETRRFETTNAGRSVDRFRGMAYSLMTSEKLRQALDVGQEPMSRREEYGMTLFGQSCLTARRLLEAGCGLVSVFWDEYVIVNTAWDTHSRQPSRLRDELHPGLDAGLSSLLSDLETRGLLDETLVMCLTEHGRTPKLNKRASRDHWSNVYSVMLAGAGIRPGTVVGSSDRQGGFVKSRPVSPEDVLATMYHLKGIDPETTIPDRLKRPVKLVANGTQIDELLL
ncbi:MAG: DUF1501 domain-containing protein [Planctomycetaceae bacterium]